MNAQRYRLEGVRYQNGKVSLQNRPMVQSEETEQEEIDEHLGGFAVVPIPAVFLDGIVRVGAGTVPRQGVDPK